MADLVVWLDVKLDFFPCQCANPIPRQSVKVSLFYNGGTDLIFMVANDKLVDERGCGRENA